VSDWHRETVGWDEEQKRGLNMRACHPLHCARDHWAVRAARAGTPVAVIQAQLGHGSPMLTLTNYRRFLPSGRPSEVGGGGNTLRLRAVKRSNIRAYSSGTVDGRLSRTLDGSGSGSH
jgi:hypothetical protein